MPDTVSGRIERKYMAHFLDSSFGGTTTSYVRLGKDLEEFTVDLSPEVEQSRNILGENTFRHSGYQEQSEAAPFYAVVGDALFEKLQEVVDKRQAGDQLKTTMVEVHLWDDVSASSSTGTDFKAYKQDCYIVPNSYGGDTSGYQIPFSVYYVGERTSGKFTIGTKTFTADS